MEKEDEFQAKENRTENRAWWLAGSPGDTRGYSAVTAGHRAPNQRPGGSKQKSIV